MNDDEDLLQELLDAPRPPKVLRASTATLARFALRAAISRSERRGLAEAAAFAMVVEVPSGDWVQPVRLACEALATWSQILARVGPRHLKDRGLADDGVAHSLAVGGRVLGVSDTPERNLPSTLRTCADLRVRIVSPPANDVIARVIRAATGKRPPKVPDAVAAGLDYGEICGAIRVGTTAQSCVDRLVAAAASKAVVDRGVAAAPLFESLHGYGDAHAWGLRLLDDLAAWRAGTLQFDALDRHVVLAGPPGVGKTTFARSLARSARLPLVATSVANWFVISSGELGGVIKAIDAEFAAARAVAPAIMLLDELDALPDRRTLSDRAREWWLTIVSHVLLTLDSATSGATSRLCIIGATNYAGRIDPALVRPGRLNRIIEIGLPDEEALAAIVRQHLGPDLPGADLSALAALAGTATGADAAAWVKAARRRARAAGRAMVVEDLLAQVVPPGDGDPAAVRGDAVHEAGHACMSHFLGVSAVRLVSVGARGRRAMTLSRSLHQSAVSRETAEAFVLVALAGRAAEIVLLGGPSSAAGGSAESDLAVATRKLAALHASYGLGESLVHRATPEDATALLALDPAILRTVHEDLARLQARAVALVRANRGVFKRVAERLVVVRYLDGATFGDLVAGWEWRSVDGRRRGRAQGSPILATGGGPHG